MTPSWPPYSRKYSVHRRSQNRRSLCHFCRRCRNRRSLWRSCRRYRNRRSLCCFCRGCQHRRRRVRSPSRHGRLQRLLRCRQFGNPRYYCRLQWWIRSQDRRVFPGSRRPYLSGFSRPCPHPPKSRYHLHQNYRRYHPAPQILFL